ncbi:FMN-binding negative transcriptional regulator [Exiguobacterium aestuarii]|uniref:FMN-binding negative transcriptional regulator n=1 Tax=Exiguobacterium aestuarii TaxID=273527 RepID=UPI001CD3C264|nr:FMN-binding negative transcriptional regulator [Exiguobacterium aestuarii]MCA0981261.1 FMN-binding negative transcriptional regulator [Exiguobacterium aestuarii]
MYIQSRYSVKDEADIFAFLHAHPFGTIVTHDGDKPIATHVPLRFNEANGQLTTHIAKANPQWRTIEDQTVLVIFQGPDAYVSASWYGHEDVSTWNYQAVHVYGRATILNEEELVEELAELLSEHEGEREHAVRWETLSEPVKRQMQGVVGFRIDITDIQATFKLSQNRSDTDHERIVSELEKQDKPIADVMRRHRKS